MTWQTVVFMALSFVLSILCAYWNRRAARFKGLLDQNIRATQLIFAFFGIKKNTMQEEAKRGCIVLVPNDGSGRRFTFADSPPKEIADQAGVPEEED